MKLIFLGPPGAGKGTQAIKTSEKFQLPQISTGDILRYNIRENTPLGVQAKAFIDKGQLVPDSLVIDIVKDRLAKEDCAKGYILDGFPRTLAQAEALTTFADIDKVINIDIDTNILVDRLSGRRVCVSCGATYHVHTHASELCDCGDTLIQRPDDQPETILNRIQVYNDQTKPLIDYYTEAGKLVTVDGALGIDHIFNEIVKILQGE